MEDELSSSRQGTFSDGYIKMIIPSSDGAGQELRKQLSEGLPQLWLKETTHPVIVAIPEQASSVRELAHELAAIERVQTNTPELHGDRVASREIAARLADAEEQLRAELERLLRGDAACDWYYSETTCRVSNARDLTTWLSDICDEKYCEAPFVHNELINRSHLSSSSAAARRTLIQRMIENAGKERLAIEGAPPELSMYRSLLEFHGLHRFDSDVYAFRSPRDMAQGSLLPA